MYITIDPELFDLEHYLIMWNFIKRFLKIKVHHIQRSGDVVGKEEVIIEC